MIKNFADLFTRKQEKAKQRRAEDSRKTKEVEYEFNKAHRNLERVISEITKGNKSGAK